MKWLNLLLMGVVAQARVSPGTVTDDSPLVVIYYENWSGWVRKFSPSHVEKNILSRDMPVRNFVLNYAFYTWNFEECSLIPVDSVDLQKGDQGGWTKDDWSVDQGGSGAAGGHLPAFMMLKSYYPHIKLLPSIGGWSRSNTYHDCLKTKMDHMIDSVMDHVTVWGWDGIDMDWEYPNCDKGKCGCQNEAVCKEETGFSNVAGEGDWDRYQTFVKTVRQRFDELEDKLGRRLYITAAIGMNPKLIDGNNDIWSVPMPLEWICDEDDLDWVNLMTYDFYGPWAPLTGPLAPLYPQNGITDQMSIDDSLSRILKRCSRPEKLTMGLATYGKAWKDVPKTGEVPGLWQTSSAEDPRGGGTWEMGTLSYFDLKKTIIPACTRTWDDVSKTPTLYCATLPAAPDLPFDEKTGALERGQSNVFISYEDGESWKVKMSYARSKGMAGAIIWAASDTGCGESFAPDSTVDLFEGLFEGWFGEKHILPASTSAKPSPGMITKFENYPCPVVTGWPTGAAAIDVSKCDGLTYEPGKTYVTLPEASSTSDIGKDKILIHPLSSVSPTTEPASPSTEPISPPYSSTRSITSPASPSVEGCKSRVSGVSPEALDLCRANCELVIKYGLCTGPPSAENTAACVSRIISVCSSQGTTSTTTKPPTSLIQQCQRDITAATPSRIALCKKNCSTTLAHNLCPSATTGEQLADCVVSNYTYCQRAAGDNSGSDEFVSACQSAMNPPAAYKEICNHNCEIASQNNLCGDIGGSYDLIQCVLNRFTYCTSTPSSNVSEDCKRLMNPLPAYKNQCDHNCDVAQEHGLCPSATTGQELALCVMSRFSYCQNFDADQIKSDCKSILAPGPAVVYVCNKYCEDMFNSASCPSVNSGAALAECVATEYPYCKSN